MPSSRDLDYMIELEKAQHGQAGLHQQDAQPADSMGGPVVGQPALQEPPKQKPGVEKPDLVNAPWHKPPRTPLPNTSTEQGGVSEPTVQEHPVDDQSSSGTKARTQNSKAQVVKGAATLEAEKVMADNAEAYPSAQSRPQLKSSPQQMWQQLYGDGGMLKKKAGCQS